MADLNFAAFQPVLKQVFPNGQYPKEEVYKGSVLLGLLPKDETAAGLGDNIKVPLRYGDPQGRSADVTKVLGVTTYQTASKHVAFQLTTYNDYCACRITGDVIDRSKRDAGAFVRPDQLDDGVRISADLARHAEWIAADARLGFSRVVLHNVNREQERFVDDFGAHVLPQLADARVGDGA